MALPVTITGISAAVAPVGPFKATVTAETLSTTNTTAGGGLAFGNTPSGTAARRGQTFTTTDAVTVSSVRLSVWRTSTQTDNLVVDIYAVDGSGLPTGSSLGTSNAVAGSSLGTTALTNLNSPTTFTFATPVALSASTKYALAISRSGAQNTTNYYNVTASGSAGYAGDLINFDGAVWVTSATNDLGFAVYAQTTTEAYYFFGRDGTTATTLQAFKSTAPDTSWATQTTKTGFTTAILNIAAYQASNVIHMLVQDGTLSSSVATKYVSYDMAADTFLATTETVSAAAALTGQAVSGWGCSLVVRSNGDVVTFYNGLQTKTSGTFRARVYYRVRTGVNTYGTETQVDANTAVDNNNPVAVLGASDRTHLLFFNQTNTIQRHLTSANVLGTAASTGSGVAIQDAVDYDDGGTIRIVGACGTNSQIRFDSADNPTVSTSSLSFGIPARGVDYAGQPYFVYSSSADSDLFVRTSTDDGATWSNADSTLTGTVASAAANLSKNQRSYQRGSLIVLPYVANDNGTLKYNEYTITSLGSVGTASGTGAATAVGAAFALAAGTGTATGATSATGSTLALAAGTGTATGATSAVGESVVIAAGAGTAAGVGAAGATGVINVVAAGVGAAVGIGAAIVTGSATGAGTGATTGIGAASAIGVGIGAGVGTSAGTGVATAAGAVTGTVTGTAAGTGAAAATGNGIAAGAGNTVGIGAASATGRLTFAATGSAAGIGAAQATVTALAASVGTAAGTGGALALSAPGVTTGSAAGQGVAAAVGSAITLTVGTVAGVGAASATGRVIASGVGSAAGVGTATVTGAVIAAGVGAASGIGTAAATGAEGGVVATGVGSAAGFGTAAAASPVAVVSSGVGRASAVGSATAVGNISVLPSLPDNGRGIRHVEILFSAYHPAAAARKERRKPVVIVTVERPARRAWIPENLAIEPVPAVHPAVLKTGKGVRPVKVIIRSIPLH